MCGQMCVPGETFEKKGQRQNRTFCATPTESELEVHFCPSSPELPGCHGFEICTNPNRITSPAASEHGPFVIRTRPVCLHNGCVGSVDGEKKKIETSSENTVLKLLYVH